MKRNNPWMFLGASALAAFLLTGCSGGDVDADAANPAALSVAVRTATVEATDIEEVLLFTGELESPLTVDVIARAQGRLDKLELKKGGEVTEGVEVKQGEVLAEVDHRALEAEVSLAGAKVQQAEVSLADKDRERRRLEALFAEDVATEQARDAAVTAHESAKASLAQAQASLRLARVNLEEAFVRAPMDGVVAKRFVDPGATVGSGTPIVKIVQMNPLRLTLSVPVRLVPTLSPGVTEVEVRTDVYPDRVFPCRVNRILPTVDTATRTVQVEILLANERPEDGMWLLRPGMYATAALSLQARRNVVTVPASALVRVLDRQIVFVADGDTARTRTVQTGIRSGERLEITEGLAVGEEYVITGQNKLTDGVRIDRVQAEPAAE